MSAAELTNMVMIYDRKINRVLVQDRALSWCGWSFPGGHAEPGESFYDGAVREIREETGLEISNLRLCGLIHWQNADNGDRYIVFLYTTSDFSGELITDCKEGRHFWVTLDELRAHPSTNGMPDYLPMFEGKGYSEAFGLWRDGEECKMLYL
jgi:ADP-ribose pyrophosphatase